MSTARVSLGASVTQLFVAPSTYRRPGGHFSLASMRIGRPYSLEYVEGEFSEVRARVLQVAS
jgi:hypothetical protein